MAIQQQGMARTPKHYLTGRPSVVCTLIIPILQRLRDVDIIPTSNISNLWAASSIRVCKVLVPLLRLSFLLRGPVGIEICIARLPLR